jgi:ferrous iron transport protein A
MRRGPGGREPLAVQVGETFFALRQIEAQCVEVSVEVCAERRPA